MTLRRAMSVLVLAALAATGLAACQTKVGAAAYVGDTRISEQKVSSYLTPQAAPYAIQQDDGSYLTVIPKQQVLALLIVDQLFPLALAKHGGPATPAELAAAKSTLLAGSAESDLATQFTSKNYRANFEPEFLKANELFVVLATRLKATDNQVTFAAINKLDESIKVNPRYGVWDSSTLGLDSHNPAYLNVASLIGETDAIPTTSN